MVGLWSGLGIRFQALTLRSAEVITEVQPDNTTGLQGDYGRIIDPKTRISPTVLFLVLKEERYSEADSTQMAFGNSDDVLSSTHMLFDRLWPE